MLTKQIATLFAALILFADSRRILLDTLCPYLLDDNGDLDANKLSLNDDYQTFEEITGLYEECVEKGLIDLDEANNEFEWADFSNYLVDLYTDSTQQLTWFVSHNDSNNINVYVEEEEEESNKIDYMPVEEIKILVEVLAKRMTGDYNIIVNDDVVFPFIKL